MIDTSTTNKHVRAITHIGIIGGMGPQASALLHAKIVKAFSSLTEINECHEYPMITHVSIPAQDFISDPALRHRNVSMLRNAAKVLNIVPVDVTVIACNTAHILVEEIPELSNLPLVSLPESAIKQAAERRATKVALIASPTTVRMKLYDNIAEKYELNLVTPSGEQLLEAEILIRMTIAGQEGPAIRNRLHRVIDQLLEQGADQVILGCTELSVIMEGLNNPNIVDALSASTHEVMNRHNALHNEVVLI